MVDIESIQRDVHALDTMKGEEKLIQARKCYDRIHAAEKHAAFRFGAVPLESIRALGDLIPVVNATINRLEAGRKRAAARKALARS